jgi:hypothetical protein
VLHWTSSGIAPLTRIRIDRSPGDAGAATVVYSAHGTSFTDRHVRDGVKYRYTLIAADLAGNVAHDGVAIRPGPHLLNPMDGAAVTSPPALRWTPVTGATYYNVQLYRGRQKVLSVWPSRTGLQLKGSWSFGGHRRHLRAGRYRWYVWPGFGRRAAVRYGHLIGSSTFMLRR